jgi:5,6-dimethylbenzimidazole synthase
MSTDLDQSPAAEVAFDYDNLLKIIRRRYSVRRFRPDPVPDELIEKVLEAGRWAPSGANHQPWEFIVVKDRDSIQQLGEVFRREEISLRSGDPKFNWPQYSYVGEAPCLIVVCADPRMKRVINRPRPPENREKTFLFSIAAAVEHMQLAATSLGLGAIWLTVQELDQYELELRRLLRVPDPIRIAIFCPIGYPHAWPDINERGVHTRRPLRELVHHDIYDASRFRSEEQIEEFVRTVTLRKGKGSWETETEASRSALAESLTGRMLRWMSWHRAPGLTAARVEELRARARHDPGVRLVRVFADVQGGQLMCVSEAATRDEVTRWFEACGLPPAELSPLQWEGDHASIHEIALFEHVTQHEA